VTVCVWFRQDLRLKDNPALYEALQTGEPILPLYILEEGEQVYPMGGASKWWLHHSLTKLAKSLEQCGNTLFLKRGDPLVLLPKLLAEYKIKAIYWNRRYDPFSIKIDTALKETLTKIGIKVLSFNANLLKEPWEIKNKENGPYKVFTPFSRAVAMAIVPKPLLPAPKEIPKGSIVAVGETLENWQLCPSKPNWALKFQDYWQPGEKNAHKQWQHFLKNGLKDYGQGRDFPSAAKTSGLSPFLHFGEISIREMYQAVTEIREQAPFAASCEVYLKQLIWREFAHHILYHFPDSIREPIRPEFKNFPWSQNKAHLAAWQKGKTGYPLVDAGMRELYQTGWMHNRVRMMVGSFLVKNLLLPWTLGLAWFWDTLLDADFPNNTMGWQWVSGAGVDAAPYFRIFNPITQGKKFDAEGIYLRKWLPELAALDTQFLHEPWNAPPEILAKAKIKLGKDYPMPIVDLAKTRKQALDIFHALPDKIRS
jgi:deoxyribodipyrimidine photo-lyase